MEDKTAPRPHCKCDVCNWLNRRIEQERELELNYQRYLRGDLVARRNTS